MWFEMYADIFISAYSPNSWQSTETNIAHVVVLTHTLTTSHYHLPTSHYSTPYPHHPHYCTLCAQAR